MNFIIIMHGTTRNVVKRKQIFPVFDLIKFTVKYYNSHFNPLPVALLTHPYSPTAEFLGQIYPSFTLADYCYKHINNQTQVVDYFIHYCKWLVLDVAQLFVHCQLDLTYIYLCYLSLSINSQYFRNKWTTNLFTTVVFTFLIFMYTYIHRPTPISYMEYVHYVYWYRNIPYTNIHSVI